MPRGGKRPRGLQGESLQYRNMISSHTGSIIRQKGYTYTLSHESEPLNNPIQSNHNALSEKRSQFHYRIFSEFFSSSFTIVILGVFSKFGVISVKMPRTALLALIDFVTKEVNLEIQHN